MRYGLKESRPVTVERVMSTSSNTLPAAMEVPSRYVDLQELRHYGVYGNDEGIGALRHVLIEDQGWTAQYLVIDAGSWMPGRLVLIPVNALNHIDRNRKRISLCYTRMELRRSIARAAQLTMTMQRAAAIERQSGSQPLWVAAVSAGEGTQPVLRGSTIELGSLPILPGRTSGTEFDVNSRAVIRCAADLLGNDVFSKGKRVGKVRALALDEKSLDIAFTLVRLHGRSERQLVPIKPGSYWAIGWADKRMVLGSAASNLAAMPTIAETRQISTRIEEVSVRLLDARSLRASTWVGVH